MGSLDDPPERQSRKRILATEFGASFATSSQSGSGVLLFLRDDSLLSQPFDPDNLELSGNPSPLVRGVGSVYQTGLFSIAGNAMMYRTASSVRDYQMTWFDRQGKSPATIGEAGAIGQVRLSPDGSRVAYRKDSYKLAGNSDLWLLDINRGASARFTFGPA